MAYVDAPSEFNVRSIFTSIEGEEKTGKTHLALTLASPHFKTGVLDLNNGLGGVVHKRVKEIGSGHIRVARHLMPEGEDKAKIKTLAKARWAEVRTDFLTSIKDNRYTFVDSGTEVWLLARQKSFGDAKAEKGSKAGSLDYEEANSSTRGLFGMHNQFGNHLVVTHQMDDEWKQQKNPDTGSMKSVRTGKRVFDGFKEIPFMIEVVLRTEKRVTNEGMFFVATLVTCRFAPKLEGTEFSEELGQFNLPFIYSYITDTEEAFWLR